MRGTRVKWLRAQLIDHGLSPSRTRMRQVKRSWKRDGAVLLREATPPQHVTGTSQGDGAFLPANRAERRRGIAGTIRTDDGRIHEVFEQTRNPAPRP